MLRFVLIICLTTCVVAKWGPWKEVNGECSEPCGMCGTRVVAERKCTKKPCSGPSEQTEICGETLCLFPKRTCCDGYIKGLVDNRLECIPKEEKKELII